MKELPIPLRNHTQDVVSHTPTLQREGDFRGGLQPFQPNPAELQAAQRLGKPPPEEVGGKSEEVHGIKREFQLNARQTTVIKALSRIVERNGNGTFVWKEDPKSKGTEVFADRLVLEGDQNAVSLVTGVLDSMNKIPFFDSKYAQILVGVIEDIYSITSPQTSSTEKR